ncbi:hypothetical protein Q060_06224 [Pseudomonas aeruginosa BL06]|nr:hypothetical protein Q065_03935 [Pseudomonas aeruginosa BL11]ERY43355.1 hypothetical protein Q060_06224 [Pseudomonas aeruginosa BL06]ETU74306.1 hypothetical protein Q094_06667 [Pseudomonas aeruginosa PS42]SUC68671.1 Uncharacterised protein [Pseudomonas aeruginosa]
MSAYSMASMPHSFQPLSRASEFLQLTYKEGRQP